MTPLDRAKCVQYLQAGALIVIGIIMVIQQQYWQHRETVNDAHDAKQDKMMAQQVARNTSLIGCVARLTVQITESTAERSAIAGRRDAAEGLKDDALALLVQDRVINQIATSDDVQKYGADFLFYHRLKKMEDKNLATERRDNPTPEFHDYCPKIAGAKAETST